MDFKDDDIKRLQLAAEAEEKKRFLHNVGSLDQIAKEEPAVEDDKSNNPSVIDKKSPLQQIRTYQGDVASALQKQNESLVSIQKRESVKQDTVQRQRGLKHETSWKTAILIFFTFVLITLGAGGGYWAYLRYEKQIAAPIVITPVNRFLPIREEKNIDAQNINREQLINLVREESNKVSSPDQGGELIQLQLRKGSGETAPILQTSEFLVLMETRVPAALARAFDNLFMIGINQGNTGKPFILIKLKSFEQAFPGMLEWEGNLREDLLPLFISSENLINISSENKFEDITIANKDARVLRDNNGNTVLLYTFIDSEMVLITSDEISLKTLQNLYSVGKLAR
jgi:hypothetical protein